MLDSADELDREREQRGEVESRERKLTPGLWNFLPR